MRYLPPLLFLPVLLALACRAADRGAEAAVDGAGVAVDPASVPGRITLEMWQLRPGVTLADWKSANPEDAVRGEDPLRQALAFGEWCAVALHDFTAGERVVTRRAYFYPPPAPADLGSPDTVPDLILDCELGLVWAGTPAADSASGVRLADSVRTQLTAAYGARDTADISFFGSAFWTVPGRYRRGGVTALSGVEAPPMDPRDGPAPARHVFGFAWLSTSGLDPDDPGLVPRPWSPPDTFALDSAVRLAGLDSALWRPLGAIAALAGDPSRAAGLAPGPADSLVRPLRRWIDAAAALPSPRRAAALYAADQVLERGQCLFRLCQQGDSAALAPLRALGAQFAFSELGGAWVYQRSWLTQARALDRDSPLGQRILLAQLARGTDFSGTCAGGSDGFRAVIENGVRYLERVPDSPIAADVHYLVAEAYRDVLALAAGEGDIYADAAAYAAEAGEAARLALQHYDEAVRLGRGRAVAPAAWRRAWWLRAGLRPRGTRYFCIYD